MDIRIENHGSIVLLTLLTGAARRWVKAHVAVENRWGSSIVVEPRYVQDIVEGAREAGLEVR